MSEQTVPLPIDPVHPAYAGHFPGRPILPGVVLLDAAVHLLAAREGRAIAGGQIKSAKFLSPVLPGESLTLHYSAAPSGDLRFDIRSDARSVASGVVALAQGA